MTRNIITKETKQMISERISLPAPYLTTSYDSLCDAFLTLKNRDEVAAFIRDICTEQEISEMSNRFKVAKLLTQDASYEAITKETKMSSSTIARVNQWLRGGLGGYRMAIKRLSIPDNSKSHHHRHITETLAKEDCADVS